MSECPPESWSYGSLDLEDDRWRIILVPQGRILALMRRERRVLNLILLDIIVLHFLEAIPDRLSRKS